MLKKLTDKLLQLLVLFKRYKVLVVLVLFGSMYGYLIYTSGQQAARQPSETKINEQFQGVSSPKLDKNVAQQLYELESQNIEIKSLFDEARNNPFSE
jgi:hypothetical protein